MEEFHHNLFLLNVESLSQEKEPKNHSPQFDLFQILPKKPQAPENDQVVNNLPVQGVLKFSYATIYIYLLYDDSIYKRGSPKADQSQKNNQVAPRSEGMYLSYSKWKITIDYSIHQNYLWKHKKGHPQIKKFQDVWPIS